VEAGRSRDWGNFAAAVTQSEQQCRIAGVQPGAIVVVTVEDGFSALAWLFGAAATGAVVAPLRAERLGETKRWQEFVALDWQVTAGGLVRVGQGAFSAGAAGLLKQLRGRGHPGLILATGGTTGAPKLVLHDLANLLAQIPVRSGRPWRTLPLMSLDHIGGLDMAWRALACGQTLVAPPPVITPGAVAEVIARHHVEVLPATPSFLNLLLLSESAGGHDLGSLRIVPYGAEPMPEGLLARLRARLPAVDFIQKFGTSETGALPVKDGGTGLRLPAPGPEFAHRIMDGELWICSPARALGYLSGQPGGFEPAGWFRTGDLAEELPDGSLRILGRCSEVINVGGEKVLPGVVEGMLLAHPLVADCRVYAQANALLGQVVAADVVWRGTETDALQVKRLLHAFGASSPKCHLPAVVRLVKSIDTTWNLKKIRPLNT
jgi:acyl-CoA synthetase (AMP-forming)/AMP-acid ligase II